MSPNSAKLIPKFRFRSSPVDNSVRKNQIRIPTYLVSSHPSKSSFIQLISKNKDNWNPFEIIKCMICWKPIEIYGRDADSYMECPHCHQKAHQDHMFRWLVKHKTCPYCRGKL
ncbi:MAG: RING finger protein [Promethearchaeota archaeon]